MKRRVLRDLTNNVGVSAEGGNFPERKQDTEVGQCVVAQLARKENSCGPSVSFNSKSTENVYAPIGLEEIYVLLNKHNFVCSEALAAGEITMNMRSILVDWMIEVVDEYSLEPETLFLSVAYVDMCLHRLSICRAELQLLGVTCIFIAAKYEEIYAPQIEKLCYITDNSYDRTQIIDMERMVLDCLNFSVMLTTTNTVVTLLLAQLCVDNICTIFAAFLSEMTLMRGELSKFSPVINAGACIFLAEFYTGNNTPSVQQFFINDSEQLRKCIQLLHLNVQEFDKKSYHALSEKYVDHNDLQISDELRGKDLRDTDLFA